MTTPERRGKGRIRTSPSYLLWSERNEREENEDSFMLLRLTPSMKQSPVVVMAVADGMGGHAHGQHVSRESLRKIASVLFERMVVERSINNANEPRSIDIETTKQILVDSLEQANAHVRRMIEANAWGTAGSTIVIAVFCDSRVVVANLGDSPCFHYRPGDHIMTKVTEDHTIAGALLRSGRITPDVALAHEGKSRLEFFLGADRPPLPIPVYEVSLEPGDLILLCSDGVSGSLLDEEIASILDRSGESLEAIADDLVQVALAKGEGDNQTLILWKCDEHGVDDQ